MGSFSKGIEYCTDEWNPVTGCEHWKTGECVVGEDCWAKRYAEGRLKGRFGYTRGFEPTLHEDRLSQPYRWKRYSRVVCTCFMGDLFGEFIPSEWVERVLEVIRDNRKHVFLLLTKNPKRYSQFEIPENAWCGVTINIKEEVERRLQPLLKLPNRKWVSLEPLLGDLKDELEQYIKERRIDWVVIGGKTGKRPKTPPKHWVNPIVKLCMDSGVPVFMKDNLTNYTMFERIQLFPVHDRIFASAIKSYKWWKFEREEKMAFFKGKERAQ